jgi:hypothetical protein
MFSLLLLLLLLTSVSYQLLRLERLASISVNCVRLSYHLLFLYRSAIIHIILFDKDNERSNEKDDVWQKPNRRGNEQAVAPSCMTFVNTNSITL